MLVLTRKEGERLVIGGTVVVTIAKIGGGRVKIGIDAPPQIAIQRDSLFDRPQGAVGNVSIRPDESPFFAECW